MEVPGEVVHELADIVYEQTGQDILDGVAVFKDEAGEFRFQRDEEWMEEHGNPRAIRMPVVDANDDFRVGTVVLWREGCHCPRIRMRDITPDTRPCKCKCFEEND